MEWQNLLPLEERFPMSNPHGEPRMSRLEAFLEILGGYVQKIRTRR
jgi:hypothetical protein